MKHYYLAIYDDGRGYGEFEFDSEHRANSKANLEDAKKKSISKYGYKRAKQINIIQVQIINDWTNTKNVRRGNLPHFLFFLFVKYKR